MRAIFSAGITELAAMLRVEHGFTIGPGHTRDALRALDAIGVRDRARVRAALRSVFCASHEETVAFDAAFEAFFSGKPAGVPQRKMRETADGALSRQPAPDAGEATAWDVMRAKYSPAPGAPRAPEIPQDGFDRAVADARRLIARLRAGRSRRWRPLRHGRKLDVRRTLRVSLRNFGEPVELRRLGHPRRDPRFVVLIDGSRSMSQHAGHAMQFALALCRQTRRARTFTFSTELREVTSELREARGAAVTMAPIGGAWGGGTRIGASLRGFVRAYGSLLDDKTYVMIFSDGFDTGEIPVLRRAMRELDRRCAAVVWINPHAATAGFVPKTAGMRAALPYVAALVAPGALRDLA